MSQRLKYLGSSIVFQEVPDEISLAINISGCPHKCEGCHSDYLWEYNGNYISDDIESLIEQYEGYITCVCFMGEGNDKKGLLELARFVLREKHLWPALYSGREEVEEDYNRFFRYIKVGPYKEEFGPLNKETTNQRLYWVHSSGCFDDNLIREDITHKFWKRQ